MVTAAVKYTLCADMLLTPGVAECLYKGLRNAQATVLIVSTMHKCVFTVPWGV